MVVPNYTYLKLKMPGPRGVITIGTPFQRAYECNVKCCEPTAVTVASEELAVIKEGTVGKRLTPSGQPGPLSSQRAPRWSS
jgi:hypothetical protein